MSAFRNGDELVKSRPIVVVNPPDDSALATLIDTELDRGLTDTQTMERRLRKQYPRAVVRPRALSGELQEVWYVYRDGHWSQSTRDRGEGE
jgi:hypothetical protein